MRSVRRVSRETKKRACEHLGVEVVLVAVAREDEQRLVWVQLRQLARVVGLVGVVKERVELVPFDKIRAVGDKRDGHAVSPFALEDGSLLVVS